MPTRIEYTEPVPTGEKIDAVNATSSAYDNMAVEGNWALIQALLGGTKAMRDAGEKFLPKEPMEDTSRYANRIERSFLYNAYEEAVDNIVTKPFSKEVSLQGESIPEQFDALAKDVDRSGVNLTQFGRELLNALVNHGLTHVLVDYPVVPEPDAATKADEDGLRPIFVHIPPSNLIGWRSVRLPNGEMELTQIRIREQTVEEEGDYLDKTVNRVRVINKTTWEVHEQQKDAEGKVVWKMIEEGKNTLGKVPLVTCYINQTGYMTGKPPLLNLAELNQAHWQSMSDQRNILRFIRVGILFACGFTEEEVQKGVTVGPNHLISTTASKTEADLKYVEHTGNAVKAGADDLEKLEAQMSVRGLQPLIKRPGTITATERAINEAKHRSQVQAWVAALENAFLRMFQVAGEWIKVALPEDFWVNIFSNFGIPFKEGAELEFLLKSVMADRISHKTFLNEIKRRGTLAEVVDVDKELAEIESEGSALGTMGLEEPKEE